MPLYEYQCKACQHTFEVMQKMSDATLPQCPECKSKKVDKLISKSGFHLKGSGWYATDYKKQTAQPSTEKPTKSDKKEKPAEKKEAASKKEDKKGDA